MNSGNHQHDFFNTSESGRFFVEIKEKKIYQYSLLNNDFREREENMFLRNLSNKIAFHATLEASDLIEANEKGRLNGKLKEIASKLDEESNPVIMLVKYKK